MRKIMTLRLFLLNRLGKFISCLGKLSIKKTNKEIISLFKACQWNNDPFLKIRYNYYIYCDKENNDTSIISMDLAGCVYKLFRETKLGED